MKNVFLILMTFVVFDCRWGSLKELLREGRKHTLNNPVNATFYNFWDIKCFPQMRLLVRTMLSGLELAN